MNLQEAATASRQLMDRHGLTSWHFKFDNAKGRFGSCNYRTRTISVSRHRVACSNCCATYGNDRFDSRFLFTWTKIDP
jgi:predicted metal-dependent hydrolase